jgi:hypothetical protein
MENAFFRQLANGLENSRRRKKDKNDDVVADANYIWLDAAASQSRINAYHQKLIDLALAPACFRHTEQGWIAVYTPRDAEAWWIPLSNDSGEQEKMARNSQFRKSGPIPEPCSRILAAGDLPLEHIAFEAGASLIPDTPFEETNEMCPDYIPSDATPTALASALNSAEFDAASNCMLAAVRRRGSALFVCASVDLDHPPKEVRLRTIYRRPLMLVGMNEGSNKEGVAWITAHIPLQENPSREAWEEFRRIRQEAENPEGPMHLELPAPSASLLICQKLTFPIGAGLETQRLVQALRDFEQDVVKTTLLAANCYLLQGQELANLCLTIDRQNHDHELPEE